MIRANSREETASSQKYVSDEHGCTCEHNSMLEWTIDLKALYLRSGAKLSRHSAPT
jgi:hypothetical protein